LITRTLGRTGLEVSRLGIGLAAIAQESLEDIASVEKVLTAALESGINFFDTAECYHDSEEMVGRAISARRDEFYLATKFGHSLSEDGQKVAPAWSAREINASIGQSLKRLRTDHVDLLQLHTCDLDVLQKGEAIEAAQRARDAGKTRFIGYSGDNEPAMWAVESGIFDTLQVSFNLTDQRPRLGLLEAAKRHDMGVIVKRPIANGAWGSVANPTANLRWGPDYGDVYWRRGRAMTEMGPIEGAPHDRIAMSLGFLFGHPEVDTAIVGTRNVGHLKSNIELVKSGVAVPESVMAELYRRWDSLDDGWVGQG
jgi:aryl-alcohol dehydrogenase-like predicted oxidoreductase